MPLVERTGHPKLSIKWSTALELLHFDLEAAVRELVTLLENWDLTLPATPDHRAFSSSEPNPPPPPLKDFLRQLARRPGMFLGSTDGWGLRSYLHGMLDGGDWLGLPALDGLQDVITKIESVSTEAYGSSFAGYRVYRHDCRQLLAWAGIDPE